MLSKARKFHALADQLREEGNFCVALNLHNLSLQAYSQDKDSAGFSESLADLSITLRHLAIKLSDDSYLILAKHIALSAVEVAEQKAPKTALALSYFNLAKAYDYLKDFPKAVEFFKKAVENLENNPPESHNRPAIKADFQIHLGKALYQSGDKSGLEVIENAIKKLIAVEGVEEDLQISDTRESTFNKNVWLSGAYLYLAEILKKDNPQKSQESLQKTKKIIDSDSRLTLRLEQWQKLQESLK